MAWQLQEAGYRPRLQAWHSVPGRNFVGWIMQELADAAYVVVLLSPDYLESEWCGAELTAALAGAVRGRKLLVPVRVAACESPELLREIGRISLVDYSEVQARQALLAELQAAADGHAVPAVPPPYPGSPAGQAPPGQAPPPYPGPGRDQLLTRTTGLVEDACRVRYSNGAINRGADGAAFPYLDVAAERDGERQRWPVGICVGQPDADA